MNCKVFWARTTERLDTRINVWLQEHPINPERVHLAFSVDHYEDANEVFFFFTAILLYEPLLPL